MRSRGLAELPWSSARDLVGRRGGLLGLWLFLCRCPWLRSVLGLASLVYLVLHAMDSWDLPAGDAWVLLVSERMGAGGMGARGGAAEEPEETRQDVWASLVFDSVSEELLEAREASWFRLESWKIALYNILTVFMHGVCYICPGCVYLHARCTVLVPEYIEVHAREHILKVHPRFTQLSARLRWSFQVCPETRWDCQDIFARFPVLLRSNTQLNNVSATTNDDNVGSSPSHWDWDPHENALRP